MNYLACMNIDIGIVRNERIFDRYGWHKKIWDCFPDMPEKERSSIGFLTRVDTLEHGYRIWILSKTKPARPRWCPLDAFALKEISSTFLSHRYYAFDLVANPTKRLVNRDTDGKMLKGDNRQGKRVSLIKTEELRDWLVRKGQVRCRDQDTGTDIPGGFRIREDKPLEILPMGSNHFRKNEIVGCHGGTRFRGILEVTDSERFMETYQAGIGSAKGFGFGLLLLAPVNLKKNDLKGGKT